MAPEIKIEWGFPLFFGKLIHSCWQIGGSYVRARNAWREKEWKPVWREDFLSQIDIRQIIYQALFLSLSLSLVFNGSVWYLLLLQRPVRKTEVRKCNCGDTNQDLKNRETRHSCNCCNCNVGINSAPWNGHPPGRHGSVATLSLTGRYSGTVANATTVYSCQFKTWDVLMFVKRTWVARKSLLLQLQRYLSDGKEEEEGVLLIISSKLKWGRIRRRTSTPGNCCSHKSRRGFGLW